MVPSGICVECWHAEAERKDRDQKAQAVLADVPAWVSKELAAIGVAPRELKADEKQIPKPLRQAVPLPTMDTLLAGLIPARGFGLGGPTGCGKTCAVVALLKQMARAYAAREAPLRGTPWLRPVLEFVSWPDEVTWLRANALEHAAQLRIERLSTVPLLVLDDLGRERIRGSYTEDWAASQLDSVVNARYRHERPTIWTTNVPEVSQDGRDLLTLYGAALVSRLTADNPLVWLPGLRSLR